MQVYKTFLRISKRHISSIALYFIIFAALSFMLAGSAKDTKINTFDSEKIDICIIDKDDSSASKGLTQYLSNLHNIVELEDDKEVIQDSLYYRKVQYVLNIEKGYEDKLMAGDTEDILTNVKVPGTYTGMYANNQINEYLSVLNMYISGGYDIDEALEKTSTNLEEIPKVNVISFAGDSKEQNKALYYFFLYQSYVFIVMLICGLAPIIIVLNKKDISDRMGCSSTSLGSRNFQIALGGATYSLIMWLLFMVLGVIAYGDAMFSTEGLLYMVNSFVFLLFATGITIFISSFGASGNALNMISNVIGLGMSFICGVFVPQWFLSDGVISVARFLPAYWYVRVSNMISGMSGEVYEFNKYLQYVGIEVIFVITSFALAMMVTRLRKINKI